ncbi:unnamed protein product [Mortierella alpina]
MAKVAKQTRPTSLPKKKSHAPPEAAAARAGGPSAAARHQVIARTSSLPLPASTSSKHAMPTHSRLLNQSRFLKPKDYARDNLKSSPKASRTQRTAPGLPSFSVRTAPSPKSANRLQSSPLNRFSASAASFRKTDRAQTNTRYSISDLEMNTPISIPSDDSSDDMPGNSGFDSQGISKAAQVPVPKGESSMKPVRTFLRLRPPLPAAADREAPFSFVDILNDTHVLMTPPPSARVKSSAKYSFTKVFDPAATQTDVFKDACAPLLTPLLREDDYNAVLFAYGVSASGKTHSIIGSNIPDQAGILPRALAVLFKSIKAAAADSGEASQYRPVGYRDVEKVDPAGLGQNSEKHRRRQLKTFRRMARQYSKTTALGGHAAGFEIPTHEGIVDYDGDAIILPQGMDYTVWISCAELSTEKIYDLLEDPSPGTQSLLLSAMGTKRQQLYLKKDNSTGQKYIDGLKEVEVRTLAEALLVLNAGLCQRQAYSKLSNKFSSRSHSIFTIKVLKTPQFGSSATEDAVKGKTSIGRLSIVDLAGPERFHTIQNAGQRQREAGNINTSLMVLGHCMHVLRTNQSKSSKIPQPVPFRHAILTQLFQSALEGRSSSTCVTLLVNSDPHGSDFDETTQVLRFASTPMDVSTPRKDAKQPFEDVISDLYEKIGAMEREREKLDEEIKSAAIEQLKNELLGEMAEHLRRERVETASTASEVPIAAPLDMSTYPTQSPATAFIEPVAPQEVSPAPREVSPAPREVSPAPREVSPAPREVSPAPREVSPAPQEVSPAPREVSPAPREVSPAPREVSPAPREVSPAPREVSPAPREASPITAQDGSDEVHAHPGSASELKRLKQLLKEANERNAAWQSWYRSAPSSAPITAARTAFSHSLTFNEMAVDLEEEEPANTEDQLSVVVYRPQPAMTTGSAVALEGALAEDEHNDGRDAISMDHAFGAAHDVISSPLENRGLPSHCQTTPDCVDDDMQSVEETGQLSPLEIDELSPDQEDAISSHCLTDVDPTEDPTDGPTEDPACAIADRDKIEPTHNDEITSSDKDELIDDEYHSGPDEAAASLPLFSPRQRPSPGPQHTAVAADTCARPESSPGAGSKLVLRDSSAQESSAGLMPLFAGSVEVAVDLRDGSPANEPEPTVFTAVEEPDRGNGALTRHSPSCNPYWGPNPFNPQEGAKNSEDDKQYEIAIIYEDVKENESATESEDVEENENATEFEDVEQHRDVRGHESFEKHEDIKGLENAKEYEDVKDYADVELDEDVKDYEEMEKYEDVREYEDVSPEEEPLPETFALGGSSPRSRSGSPYWDASSLSPQVIAAEFEEPEPGQGISSTHTTPPHTPPPRSPPAHSPPPHSPPPQTPPRQTPPRQTPPRQTLPRQTPPRQTPPRRSPLISPVWEAGPFSFELDERHGHEADAEQVSTQLSAHQEAQQPTDGHETLLAVVAPMTPKRKRKLRQKNAVFEEEMGESVGLPPPETLTRRKRTRRWD